MTHPVKSLSLISRAPPLFHRADSPNSSAIVVVADALPASTAPAPPPPLLTWSSPSAESAAPTGWTAVWALEDQQRRRLHRIWERSVAWKPPTSLPLPPLIFRLDHAGEVDADGNCLFTAARRAAAAKPDARDLRHRTVRRFADVYASAPAPAPDRDAIDEAVRHLYAPDLKAGWGVHVVQELKLLAIDAAIRDLVDLGIQRFLNSVGFDKIC
ncbi:hypothetical protein GUJ93_ZPchr0010g8717 [Zizania palustris]|uniref:OTU domain-containing protein n=1 Tax=Zizania palustris TaxID=103762 RepID=A0A8J5WED7_ZIZPA|nr:hypothetical protein GUJ93_ZPchr0010g8717 [Zizania palustris]